MSPTNSGHSNPNHPENALAPRLRMNYAPVGMKKPAQSDAFPAAKTLCYRATFSLPAKLAQDINRLAKRMGVSQSALLSELLTEPITAMCDIIDQIPSTGATTDDVKRAKGKSVALIRDIVGQAQSLVHELDDDGNR